MVTAVDSIITAGLLNSKQATGQVRNTTSHLGPQRIRQFFICKFFNGERLKDLTYSLYETFRPPWVQHTIKVMTIKKVCKYQNVSGTLYKILRGEYLAAVHQKKKCQRDLYTPDLILLFRSFKIIPCSSSNS
jgi:hypothetical protein